jgi:flagellar hook assembly protein FlgD
MKIQIMTVSGKVVREIFSDEIGPIHIGNNITEYAWDGKDDFGDQLANGVYLYRVIINNPSDNFKHRETSGDQGFDRGFGKIYLLR